MIKIFPGGWLSATGRSSSNFRRNYGQGTRTTFVATPRKPLRLRMPVALQLPPGTPVALETGTSAFYVARALSALDLKPVVIDAHEVRVKARRPAQKSDRRDAFELCDGLRRDLYRSIVHIPSPAIVGIRCCPPTRSPRTRSTEYDHQAHLEERSAEDQARRVGLHGPAQRQAGAAGS